MFKLNNDAVKKLNEIMKDSTKNLEGINIWFSDSTMYIYASDTPMTYGLCLKNGDVHPFFMTIYEEVKKYLESEE